MSLLSRANHIVKESVATHGLAIKCFDVWAHELDEALRYLPETDVLPHDLFRSLMSLSGSGGKRLILVTDRKEPVALAGLRDRWGGWEPVTQWIVPGVLFPIKNDKQIPGVLAAIGLYLHVGWWRWTVPPPQVRWISNATSTPTYGTHCAADFEEYWRKSDFFKNVRYYRNRCRGFTFHVNRQGTREWTIRGWDAKWRKPGALEMPDLAERLLASESLENEGLYHTLSLFDRNVPVAGLTFLSHRNAAVAHVNYRDPQYDRYGVMNRMMDLSFYWAKDRGFEQIDLGGSFQYKEKWAPQNGEKWEFDVTPRYIPLRDSASQLWSRVRRLF